MRNSHKTAMNQLFYGMAHIASIISEFRVEVVVNDIYCGAANRNTWPSILRTLTIPAKENPLKLKFFGLV